MNQEEREAVENTATGSAESPSGADASQQLADVLGERDQLAAEKTELQDRLLRRMAEFDNFRRRVEREKSEIREFSAMETIRQMLPILDDFERALKIETQDKEYARGMELILQRLAGELQKLGLEPIASEGQPFDPHIHHAVEMRETDEVEDHTVLAELQKGYNFRGRLLRPAMVAVAVAPSSEKKPQA